MRYVTWERTKSNLYLMLSKFQMLISIFKLDSQLHVVALFSFEFEQHLLLSNILQQMQSFLLYNSSSNVIKSNALFNLKGNPFMLAQEQIKPNANAFGGRCGVKKGQRKGEEGASVVFVQQPVEQC